MIAKLTGKLDSFLQDSLILDVNGVGYEVFVSKINLHNLGQAGDVTVLHIETIVREDSMTLYGFKSTEEKQWFRLLTSVQGVGAKAALAILSAASLSMLASAISVQDKAVLTKADGVGPKLATRIVTELKDKVANVAVASFHANGSSAGSDAATASEAASTDNVIVGDAVSALANLGYAKAEAYQAVSSVVNDNPDMELPNLITASLKKLAG